MKAVIFSDVHLDATTCGRSRFEDIAGACDSIVDYAINQGANSLIFLGDLCDADSPRSHACLAELARWVARTRGMLDFTIIAGNHDVVEDGSGSTLYDALQELEGGNVNVITEPEIFELWRGMKAAALPFTARACSYDPGAFVAGNDAPAVCLGHLNITGATVGSESGDFLRGRDVFWPLPELRKHWPKTRLIGGHYHGGQVVEGIHIVGSPAIFNFGEEKNTPGFLSLQSDPKHKLILQRHVIPAAKVRRLKTVRTVAELHELAQSPDAFARIITGTEAAAIGIGGAPFSGVVYHSEDSESQPPSIAPALTAEDFEAESIRVAEQWKVENERLKGNIETMVREVLDETRSA